MDYETVIGLEVHVQLDTVSKMFCSCGSDYQLADPNSRVCPICLGLPGSLPQINGKAVEYTILTGLALNCVIPEYTKFDRKNYPYPDLMKGYQISQFDKPLALAGALEIESNGRIKIVNITRIHLEEDVAKLTHITDNTGSYSVVDVNRAGVALMEIVSEPDMRSSEEARQYLQNLHAIVQYLGVSKANMQDGNFRCDANVSVRPKGTTELTTRTEVKNMNSFKAVVQAIEYERDRQIKVVESGGTVVQETRGWVDDKQITSSQRSKEQAHDYRYFPEPDLPPLNITIELVNKLSALMPELPRLRNKRFICELGLSEYDAGVLISDKPMADYFESVLEGIENINNSAVKTTANILLGDMTALLKEANEDFLSCSLPPSYVSNLIQMIQNGTINLSLSKTVLSECYSKKQKPDIIVKNNNYSVISDPDVLVNTIKKIVDENPKAVEDYNTGKESASKFLVGQVMKETKGQAKPDLVSTILLEMLSK